MNSALARAQADLAAGRAWKARDRLQGLLRHRVDFEVLDLLAEVYYDMGDLPAAGALWFVTGRDDERARASVDAWHERHGDGRARWQSIPGSVRRGVQTDELTALEVSARRLQDKARPTPRPGRRDRSLWKSMLFEILPIGVRGGPCADLHWQLDGGQVDIDLTLYEVSFN